MMCPTFGTIVMANNDLAGGGGTYETPYTVLTTLHILLRFGTRGILNITPPPHGIVQDVYHWRNMLV